MDKYIKRKDAIDICTECVEFQDSIENINASAEAMRIRRLIKELPSADVVERKHGKWELFNNSGLGFSHGCSLCNFEVRERWIDLYNFCPNCGADMRGEDDVC